MQVMRSDLRYLRAFREHRDDRGVLNGEFRSPPPSPSSPDLIAGGLLRALLARNASRAAALRCELAGCDPLALDRHEQVAFWLNVYNALVIDALRTFGVHGSVLDTRGFFHRAAYTICHHRFSLADIEHGVLRGNRPAHPRLPAQFEPADDRLVFAMGSPDPRLHFALNCGARSCPPVRPYHGETLDKELDSVTRTFLSAELTLNDEQVAIPAIVYQYADDFGGSDAISSWLMDHVNDPVARELIAAGRMTPAEFDWSLSAAVPVQ